MLKITIAATILVVFFISGQATWAAPKPVNDTKAAKLFGNCLLAPDSDTGPDGYGKKTGGAKCCSKTLGYCIFCPGSLKMLCRKVSYFRGSMSPDQSAPDPGAIDPAYTPSTNGQNCFYRCVYYCPRGEEGSCHNQCESVCGVSMPCDECVSRGPEATHKK